MARYNSEVTSNKKSLRVTCPVCGSSVVSSSLKIHVDAVHLKLKLHSCTFEGCTLRFATTGGVKAHRSKHTGEKFPCRVIGCPKGFADGANALRHYKDAHLGKKWICLLEGCSDPIVAPRHESMKRHLKNHHLTNDYTMADYEERNMLEVEAYQRAISADSSEASATPYSSASLLTPLWPSMLPMEENHSSFKYMDPADAFSGQLDTSQEISEILHSLSLNGAASHPKAASMEPFDMSWFFTPEVRSKPTPESFSDADMEAVAAHGFWLGIQGQGGEFGGAGPSSLTYAPMGTEAPMDVFLHASGSYSGGLTHGYHTAGPNAGTLAAYIGFDH